MNSSALDQTDREIIRLLQQDARLSSKEIAARLKRRPSTIFARFNRLKELGYLTGSTVLIDRNKFADLMTVFINVQLNDHSCEALSAFQEDMAPHPEVMECYHTTGQVDYVLKVVVNDMAAYKDFLVKKLTSNLNVKGYASHFVIAENKRELAYPMQHLL
ncbi:Lrp/AsnC family transcriptional regulator [Pedobacter deserti]|uniref:Lrp/AsnC family transcriptional regulator n=1 Tax=Pedobacter deserti TaxID=2817382 RepID=UPI00210EDD77|nr:Lrp/AsnC family transcriptional regulator [Pedobacter sp. SYSU D00382]